MTYSPGSPGSSGYPSAQPPGSYGAPAPFGQAAESGPSKLPLYLSVAVAVLGLIAYLLTFGPMFTLSAEVGPFVSEVTAGGSGLPILAALAAALLAGAGLLPKANNYHAVVAVLATLGALLALSDLLGKPDGFSVGWAFWVFLAATVLQSVAAIVALLFDSGLITPPAPRPRYDQGQYGQYGPPGATTASPASRSPAPASGPATRRSTAATVARSNRSRAATAPRRVPSSRVARSRVRPPRRPDIPRSARRRPSARAPLRGRSDLAERPHSAGAHAAAVQRAVVLVTRIART